MIVAAVADVLLQLSLKPGEVHRYKVVRAYRETEGTGTLTYTEDWSFTVAPGDGPKRKIRVSSRLSGFKVDDSAVPLDAQAPTTWEEERVANGQVLARDPDLYFPLLRGRQNRVLDVKFGTDPHPIGSKWEADKPADPETGFPAATWTWTLSAATDATATIVLKFAERETERPVTADGTIVIDRKDGWPVSVDVTVRNTEIPGDEERSKADLTVTWKRL
ncbi:MAG: hypothetical protein JST30_13560 [Armatimonadetes bacterium]|nr:hypothetical protein [Armatimonadota bacterium]